MNIKAQERLLNAFIVVVVVVLLLVVGYPLRQEASPSSVEITSGKIMDGIVVPPQSTMKSPIDLKDKRLGYVLYDGYLIDMILKRLANENNIIITRIPLQPEEVPSAFAPGVDALYLLDPYRGCIFYEGNKIILEGLISSVHAMPREFLFEKTDFLRQNRS